MLFPGGRAFPEPVADPRESRFGFDWVESGRVSGRAGRSVALVRDGAFDLRLDGMLWAWLRQTPGFNFPLETIDGQFGMALEAHHDAFSGRLRYGHASSHVSDGNAAYGQDPKVWSRETLMLLAAWTSDRLSEPLPSPRFTIYAGPTFMLRGEPDEPAFTGQLGGSMRLGRSAFVPYAAFDLRMKAENESRVNQSYELGASYRTAFRVTAGYEAGVSERGQFQPHVEHFFRLGVTLGD